MAGIFLSYRRSDAEGQAGRLYDDLAEQFGPGTVFMDVAGIEAGRDFRQALDQHVSSCSVLLALIGKEWLSAADPQGRRRLDDANDFVRLEIATALKRDIPVVPVLVRGAAMPQAADLPADCADLSYRNAVELTHARWNSDVQVLIEALRRHVGAAKAAVPQSATASSAAGPHSGPGAVAPAKAGGAGRWMSGVAIAMAVMGGGVMVYRSNDGGDAKPALPTQPAGPPSTAGINPAPPDAAAQLPAALPAADQNSTLLPAADSAAVANQAKGGAASATPDTTQAVSGNALSEWMLANQFQTYRQALPPEKRFPYDIELQCVRKGENRMRARFGPHPRGVQEVRVGYHLFRGDPKLPAVEGFREFSIARCDMPKGGQMIVRVMVRP